MIKKSSIHAAYYTSQFKRFSNLKIRARVRAQVNISSDYPSESSHVFIETRKSKLQEMVQTKTKKTVSLGLFSFRFMILSSVNPFN